MSNLIKLIKIELLNIYSINKLKENIKDNSTLKEKITMFAIFLLFILSFYSLLLGLDEFYNALNNLNKLKLYFPIILIGTSVFQVFIGFINLFSKYFYSKDLKLLFQLPIKIGDIFLSKFISTLMRDYILTVPVLTGVFYIYSKYNGFYLLNISVYIITFLTLGILPYFINSIIILIIGNITSSSNNKDRFRIIYSIIFILSFIIFQNKMMDFSFSLENLDILLMKYEVKILNTSLYKLSPIYFLIKGIHEKNILNILFYIVYNMGLLLFIRFLGNRYFLSALERKNKKLKKKDHKLPIVKKGNIRSIFERELLEIVRTPSYFINVVAGIILIPILLYINVKLLNSQIEGEILKFNIYILSITLNLATNISSSSISREGRSNYLNYILPINYKEQFLGRYLASILLSMIQIFLSTILLTFLKLKELNLVTFLIVNINIISIATFTGLAIDKKNPKLQWKYPEEAMKRNLNVLKNLILNFILGIILLIIIKDNNLLNVLLGLILNFYIYKVSIKTFKR